METREKLGSNPVLFTAGKHKVLGDRRNSVLGLWKESLFMNGSFMNRWVLAEFLTPIGSLTSLKLLYMNKDTKEKLKSNTELLSLYIQMKINKLSFKNLKIL